MRRERHYGRRFILGATGAILLGAVAKNRFDYYTGNGDAHDTEERPLREVRTPRPQRETRESAPEVVTVRTGRLAGVRAMGLTAYYLGVAEGTILPETLQINFREILRRLWEKKKDRVQRRQPDRAANIQNGEDAYLAAYAAAHESGDTQGHTLESVCDDLQPVIERLNASMNFDEIKNLEHHGSLNDEDIRLIRTLAGKIDARMLLAYAATELMPLENGAEENVDILELLVSNGGHQFPAAVPALFDEMLSAGWLQFTSHAVNDGPGGPEGASITNRLVTEPDLRIPGSVIHMTATEEQFKAAYLFAVYNLAGLLVSIRSERRTAARRMEILHANAPRMRESLLQFIASAHHNPSHAKRAFKKYIDANMENGHARHCSNRIRRYVEQSHDIFGELGSRFGSR